MAGRNIGDLVLLSHTDTTLVVELKFFGRDVEFPVDHGDEETLHFVHVGEGDAADLRDVGVRVVSVVVHLGSHEYRREQQPKNKKKR